MLLMLSSSGAASVHGRPKQHHARSLPSFDALVLGRLQHLRSAVQPSTGTHRQTCTAIVAPALPSAAEASAAGQTEAAADSSQETARAAQALVSEAANQQRNGDVNANRQGLALLAAAAAIWAAAHRDAMLAALARIPIPDAAAALLAAAAVIRSVAYDIGEVRKDIKQLRSAMEGLYARAAWVPPKLNEQERQQQRQKRKRGPKWSGSPAGVHKA